MNPSLMFLVLSLGAGAPSPTVAFAPAEAKAQTAVADVKLYVDHTPLLSKQMALAAEKSGLFVREDVTRALREQHGRSVVEDDTAPMIIVKLAWADYENSVYRIEISTRRPGEDAEVVESFDASCINNSALAAVVLSKLPETLETLEEPEDAAPAPAVAPEDEEPIAEEPIAVVDEPRRPLGTLGRAGIGVGAVGLASLISGGIVFAQGRRPDEPAGLLEERQGLDYEPPGIALMVTGGAALVSGVVMLAIDRRNGRKPRHAAVLPTPGGLLLTGRF